MSAWSLPTTATVDGKETPIRSDFRAVLDALAALDDLDLTMPERAAACVRILYPEWKDIQDWDGAFKAAMEFINLGEPTPENQPPKPKPVSYTHLRDNIGRCKGRIIPNRIFTSTSFRQLGLPGRDTVIELHVPAGHHGALYIRDLAHPQYKLQDEVLFARGLKYRILSVDASGERVYIKAEVIKT